MLSFIFCLSTVCSLDDFYLTHLPSLKKANKTIKVNYDITIEYNAEKMPEI